MERSFSTRINTQKRKGRKILQENPDDPTTWKLTTLKKKIKDKGLRAIGPKENLLKIYLQTLEN